MRVYFRSLYYLLQISIMHDIHAPIGKIPFQEGAELHLLGQSKDVPIMFGWALNYD